MSSFQFRALVALVCSVVGMASGAQAPVIAIAADAYRLWERWPYQRIGDRAYMRSTYDRAGGNDPATPSHFLYQLADDLQRHARCRGLGRAVFRAHQSLARQPLALHRRWHGSHRAGIQYGGSPAPDRRLAVHAASGVSASTDMDLDANQGLGFELGTDRVPEIAASGLCAHVLRHRLLHLSSL